MVAGDALGFEVMPDAEYYDALESMWRSADMYEDEPDGGMDEVRSAGNAGSDHEVPDHEGI